MSLIERAADAATALLFRHRALLVVGFLALTALMGWQAARIRVDAGFAKMLPQGHPYIATYLEYQERFGGANRVLIALSTREGDIFNGPFLDALRRLTAEASALPGVDRSQVESLFTPNARYIEVVEDGLSAGNIIPADFSPTPEGLARVRENVLKSGKVGRLVANDFTAAMVSVQLVEVDPRTGRRIDLLEFARVMEARLRAPYEAEFARRELPWGIHIIGYAQVAGDVASGARQVVLFFGLSFLITGLLVYLYCHSWRMTLWPLLCSVLAVLWQLGALSALGYGIDPMSILVPFLVFAIGVSHGVQMVRSFRDELFAGKDSLAAAQRAFRLLFVPGGVALITDTIGFLTILLIPIPMLRELAITASLGVGVILVTNLFLLPILLSYTRPPAGYVQRVACRRARTDRFWLRVDIVTHPVASGLVLLASVALAGIGLAYAGKVRVGDIHAGVPELREDSRYNRDSAAITRLFSIGADVLTVIVEMPADGVAEPDLMREISRLEWTLRRIEGVQSTLSVASVAQSLSAAWNEGYPKWKSLPANRAALAQTVAPIETGTGLLNPDGSRAPVLTFLTDHRAETLDRVVQAVEAFQSAHGSDRIRFRLATGNAGVMAATNSVVDAAQFPILFWVFGSVAALCLLTFSCWRATLCIVVPLALVSLLSYVVMYALGIGLKVSTLPVVSLGVGIGVDYGIYLFSRLQVDLRRGDYFEESMARTLQQTGSAVVFTALTLALGVATWIFSDLKFQADMGLLLTFMFLANMLGAVLLLPALARWFFRHHRSFLGEHTQPPFPSKP